MNILKHCINEKRAANNILFIIYIQASATLVHGRKKERTYSFGLAQKA